MHTSIHQLYKHANTCKSIAKTLEACRYSFHELIGVDDLIKHCGVTGALTVPVTAFLNVDPDHLRLCYQLFSVACCFDTWRFLPDKRSRAAVIATHLHINDEISDKYMARVSREALGAKKAMAIKTAHFAAEVKRGAGPEVVRAAAKSRARMAAAKAAVGVTEICFINSSQLYEDDIQLHNMIKASQSRKLAMDVANFVGEAFAAWARSEQQGTGLKASIDVYLSAASGRVKQAENFKSIFSAATSQNA